MLFHLLCAKLAYFIFFRRSPLRRLAPPRAASELHLRRRRRHIRRGPRLRIDSGLRRRRVSRPGQWRGATKRMIAVRLRLPHGGLQILVQPRLSPLGRKHRSANPDWQD